MMRLPPEKDPTSIGNILIQMGLLSELELLELVKDFRAAKEELLGEFIAKRSEKVSQYHIDMALTKQRMMRGEKGRKIIEGLVKVSSNNHKRIMSGIDELTMMAKKHVKANGG